jgi:hypothetical protein
MNYKTKKRRYDNEILRTEPNKRIKIKDDKRIITLNRDVISLILKIKYKNFERELVMYFARNRYDNFCDMVIFENVRFRSGVYFNEEVVNIAVMSDVRQDIGKYNNSIIVCRNRKSDKFCMKLCYEKLPKSVIWYYSHYENGSKYHIDAEDSHFSAFLYRQSCELDTIVKKMIQLNYVHYK